MPVVTLPTLKTYFEDGKEPDESKYIDLIDTLAAGGGDHGVLTGLADDDHLQYLLADGSRVVSGNFTVGDGSDAYLSLSLDRAAGQSRDLVWKSAGVNRWIFRVNATAESGSNVGSDFELTSRKDDGTWLATPLKIIRATGNVTLSSYLNVGQGLSVGDGSPPIAVRGTIFLDHTGSNSYGFISSVLNLHLSANRYYDGSVWRNITAGKSATIQTSVGTGWAFIVGGDNTSRSAGAVSTTVVGFNIDLVGNAGLKGGLSVGSITPVTTAGRIKATERILAAQGMVVGYNSGTPGNADSISFYSGTTKVGEIGSDNVTWLKLNHITNKGIYSPRHMRIDGGISATSGISNAGAGNVAGASINIYEGAAWVGDIQAIDGTWLRINRTTGKNIYSQRSIVIAGALMSGTSYLPGNGYTGYTVALKPYKNTTGYTCYSYHPYTSYITIWNGLNSSDIGATKIDLSTFGLPAGVKAVNVRLIAEDSKTTHEDDLYVTLGPNTTQWQVIARPVGYSLKANQTGVTACDSNGDIYYRVNASGANTMWRYLYILGYYI